MKLKLLALMAVAAAVSIACGGSDPAPSVLVASGDATVNANSAVAGAVANTPFTFPSGVTSFGTSGTTTVQFTNTATTPAFSIASGSNTAAGTTEFGSCIFRVTSSSFPAGNPLALGQTVTVNPCSLSVRTTGAVANGQPTSRSVALLLGAASSANATVTVAVTASGQLTLNGASAGLVQLVPVSGS